MTTTKVGEAADFAEGAIVPVEAGGRHLILARVDGTLHAMARKCTHMGADLCNGTIAAGTIICPKHRAAFKLVTGEPVDPAKILFLKMKPKPLATYPVTIDGDDVLVTVG